MVNCLSSVPATGTPFYWIAVLFFLFRPPIFLRLNEYLIGPWSGIIYVCKDGKTGKKWNHYENEITIQKWMAKFYDTDPKVNTLFVSNILLQSSPYTAKQTLPSLPMHIQRRWWHNKRENDRRWFSRSEIPLKCKIKQSKRLSNLVSSTWWRVIAKYVHRNSYCNVAKNVSPLN